jgi:hypothetical protein
MTKVPKDYVQTLDEFKRNDYNATKTAMFKVFDNPQLKPIITLADLRSMISQSAQNEIENLDYIERIRVRFTTMVQNLKDGGASITDEELNGFFINMFTAQRRNVINERLRLIGGLTTAANAPSRDKVAEIVECSYPFTAAQTTMAILELDQKEKSPTHTTGSAR